MRIRPGGLSGSWAGRARRLAAVVAVCAGGFAAAGESMGWRGAGAAIFEGTAPPSSLSTPAWSTPMAGWSNASLVLAGGKACGMAEHTVAFCLDAATGRVVWKAENTYLDTLPAAQRPAEAARLSETDALLEEVRELQRQMSATRRDGRREGRDVSAELAELSARMDRAKAEVDARIDFLTSRDLGMIGYTAATPVSDGESLWVMVGHGVVSRFSLSGERKWSVWIGPPVRPMIGFEYGSTASPQLVDGLLIVAHGSLRALDAETGREVWREKAPWMQYGAPAVVRAGGQAFLVTPDGRAVRAKDGVTVAKDLGDIWYTGPVAVGDTVWIVGSHGTEADPDNARGWAWKLVPDGKGGVTPKKLWERRMPKPNRIYAAPLIHDGLLYAITREGLLQVLDAATGADVYVAALREALQADAFQAVSLAGGQVWVGSEEGRFATVRPGRSFEATGVLRLPERSRANLVFQGKSVFARTESAVMRFDAP